MAQGVACKVCKSTFLVKSSEKATAKCPYLDKHDSKDVVPNKFEGEGGTRK